MLQFYIPEIKSVEQVRKISQLYKSKFYLNFNLFYYQAETELDKQSDKEFNEVEKEIEKK